MKIASFNTHKCLNTQTSNDRSKMENNRPRDNYRNDIQPKQTGGEKNIPPIRIFFVSLHRYFYSEM